MTCAKCDGAILYAGLFASMRSLLTFALMTGFLGVGDILGQNPVVAEPDEIARFPGCEKDRWNVAERSYCASKKMLAFIYKHLKYPKEARKKGISGFVVVGFIVDEYGYLSQFEVAKDLGFGTGEEAVRVFNLMNEMKNPWIPAKHDGQATMSRVSIPIMYKLD